MITNGLFLWLLVIFYYFINNIESVVLDQKDQECICNLVGEKNITLSLNQKENLFSHTSFFSNQFIQ
jgi:hypothetical protein